jgi:two-component system response regulator AtoC
VLESGEVMRLGALRPKFVDVRFVSATNRDLDQRIAEGAFRADLFFRLNGVTLTLPSLRERKDDILPLAEAFATRACAKVGRPRPAFDGAARAALEGHLWPGNIRELRNVVERAVLLCQSTRVTVEDLGLAPARPAATPQAASGARPSGAPPAPPSGSLRDDVEAVEKQRILDALEQCAGNQSRAAKLLGIGRRTLIDKLDAYGLPRPRKGRLDADD